MGLQDQLCFAEDIGNAANATVGENPYKCYLITSSGGSIDIDTLANIASVNALRIVVGPNDGYNINSIFLNPNSDGYNNPIVKEIKTRVLQASGGSLTTRAVQVGPIVFPYNTGFNTGGIDPHSFEPVGNVQSIYVQIVGPGAIGNNNQGHTYTVSEVRLDKMSDLCYYLILTSVSGIPQGVNSTVVQDALTFPSY